jgi:hypothetical protein
MENVGNVGTYQTINIRPNETIPDAWYAYSLCIHEAKYANFWVW